MNSVQAQSQELASKLWDIANELRGTMDSSKFKDYILSVIFYRYLSEKTEQYVDTLLKNDHITYRQALEIPEMQKEIDEMLLSHLGYIIRPDDLFSSLISKIKDTKLEDENEEDTKKDIEKELVAEKQIKYLATKKDEKDKFTVEKLQKAISNIVGSTDGKPSSPAFANLFDDLDLKNKDLGKEVSDRTKKISQIMKKINAISFSAENSDIDILGTAYMILISLFASDAGKKGGEFFTPTCASTLLAKLATVGLTSVKNVCDCTAGSGSLLLEIEKQLKGGKVTHFYCQEYNGSTFNMLRMNMLIHVGYERFTAFNDDTLRKDNFYENGKPITFTVQVANPPYSTKNTAFSETFKNDPRYKAAGLLAPKNKADLAFVEHMVYHMAEDGRIAVLLPHGVLFRGGSELAIRKHLIKTLNCIDAIIGLPANMFHGASIPVCVLVMKKYRNGNSSNILFIDASKEFKKGKDNNYLTDENIEKIVSTYEKRVDVPKYSSIVALQRIEENNYNLNIPRYVDTYEEEPEIDLQKLTDEMNNTDKEINKVTNELKQYFKELNLEFPF